MLTRFQFMQSWGELGDGDWLFQKVGEKNFRQQLKMQKSHYVFSLLRVGNRQKLLNNYLDKQIRGDMSYCSYDLHIGR